MKTTRITVLCLAALSGAWAQQQKPVAPKQPSQTTAAVLEAKVRKAWEDFKNKDKKSFAAILADGFREVEDDGEGFRDAKAEVAEIDGFEITQYSLKDFTVKSLGAEGALVNYVAEYSGSAAGQKVQERDIFGEVWVKRGNDWKLLYVQETKVK